MQSRKNDRELRMEHFPGNLTDAYPNLRRLSKKGSAKALYFRFDRLRCVRTKDGAVPNSAPNFAPKIEKLNGKKSKKAQKKAENKHFQLIFSLYGADEGT